jgi:hypothetical protein
MCQVIMEMHGIRREIVKIGLHNVLNIMESVTHSALKGRTSVLETKG